MSNKWTSSFGNPDSKLCRSINEALSRLFGKIFESSRNVSEQAKRVTNYIQTAHNLVKLFHTVGFIHSNELVSDGIYSLDAVLYFEAAYVNGSTVDIGDQDAHCRENSTEKLVVLES